ncbi:esterase/lipase family protein [Lentisalinibacter salinarum]|uniref:esterase/lipase family protein n=1 Tax=Lentisalinibacter salinarum TaxID=2992239 RepID=UPI003864189F
MNHEGDRSALVLVHGLWLGGWALKRLARRLREAGRDDVHIFSWPTISHGLDANAQNLRAFAAHLEPARIDWVGHSLGGVLILRTLAGWGEAPPGRIVCLGSPLTGSRSAERLSSFGLGRRLTGRSIAGGVLESSAAEWCPPDLAARTGVIAGSRGMGAGRLLGRLEPPHDGTVRVAETKLPGIADHLVLNVTHTGLLFSRAAAAAAETFLRRGKFA